MKDPLAGRREAINEGRASALTWPDKGDGCPVEVDQVIVLRSCWIQITKKQRLREGSKWIWRVWFHRYVPIRPQFLARRGGITEDLDKAMGAQDDPDASTLDRVAEDERSLEHRAAGEPPEPEAVPKEEIANYVGSVEGRQRYLLDMAEQRLEEEGAPLELRLARLREHARNRHVDISSDLRVIEQRVAAAERKVLERVAA